MKEEEKRKIKRKNGGRFKKNEAGLKNKVGLSIWVRSYLVIFSFLMELHKGKNLQIVLEKWFSWHLCELAHQPRRHYR